VLNPNLLIMMSGMTIIANATTSIPVVLAGTALLLLAAAVDFLLPIGVYNILGTRAHAALDSANRWIIEHDRSLSIGVLLGFGVLFAGRGLLALL
jgi:hypothetical protein